jgi:hypothetical protein
MTQTGDCAIGYGKILSKKVEKGEYLVEIDAWLDNMCRGNITESARAWVKLPSRGTGEQKVKVEKTTPGTNGFKPGDKVIIKARTKNCFPTGYPLANAEGVVLAAIYPWQLAYTDYDGCVPVRVLKADTPLGIGNELMFRAEELEKM